MAFQVNIQGVDVEFTLSRGFQGTRLEEDEKQLHKIEQDLSRCRTSTIEDGFGTGRHARKSRNWDALAVEKNNIRQRLSDLGVEL